MVGAFATASVRVHPVMSHTSTLHSLFTTPGFLAFSAFRLCRSISTWIELTLIYTLLIFHYQASLSTVTIAAVLVSVPRLILTPVVGAFCDRHSPVVVMRVSALCRASVAALMSMTNALPAFVVLMFIRSIALTGEAAETVVNRRLLVRHKLQPAARVNVVIEHGTKLLAPVIGSAVAALAVARYGFLVSAGLCGLCVVISVYLARTVPICIAVPAVASGRRSLLVGLQLTLTTQGSLFNVCMVYASMCFALGSLNPLLLILLRDNNLSRGLLGALIMSMSLGALLGGIGFDRIFRKAALVNVLISSQLALCAVVACIGLLSNFFYPYPVWLLSTFYGLTGFFFASASVAIFVIIPDTAPLACIGAVSATAKSVFFLFTLLAPILSSFLAHTIDAYAGLFIVGLLGTLIGAVTSLRDTE